MSFILEAHNYINKLNKDKIKSPKLEHIKLEPIIEPIKIEIKLSPRIKNRVKSMDNFMKYQWSWTL